MPSNVGFSQEQQRYWLDVATRNLSKKKKKRKKEKRKKRKRKRKKKLFT